MSVIWFPDGVKGSFQSKPFWDSAFKLFLLIPSYCFWNAPVPTCQEFAVLRARCVWGWDLKGWERLPWLRWVQQPGKQTPELCSGQGRAALAIGWCTHTKVHIPATLGDPKTLRGKETSMSFPKGERWGWRTSPGVTGEHRLFPTYPTFRAGLQTPGAHLCLHNSMVNAFTSPISQLCNIYFGSIINLLLLLLVSWHKLRIGKVNSSN